MSYKNTSGFFRWAVLLICCFWQCGPPDGKLITITEDMVINETGSGNHMAWFDEQRLDGEPSTYWKTYGITTYWPAGVVIDLGTPYRITEVWVFDGRKEKHVEGGRFQVALGKPFAWSAPIQRSLSNRGEWLRIPIDAETRYIQLQKLSTMQYKVTDPYPENYDVAIREVVIKGYPMGRASLTKLAQPNQHVVTTTMDKFIGMNSYIHTPDKVHGAVGTVREYRPWRWNGVLDLDTPIDWGDIVDRGSRKGSPSRTSGNSDVYYQKMKEMGIECVPCVHRHVDEANHKEGIPHFGGHPADPLSYRMISDYSFQFVARYGHSKVDETLLRTTESNPKSGLGLIRYFENWNEPNGWWGMPSEHFTPYQFAAFCSASYDGHLNRMGKGFGVKNADSSINYVFGGLAELSLSYVQAMKWWADHHRAGSFPADVINLHHYSNTMGKQHGGEHAYGISPEEDGLKEKLQNIVAWRNQHLPEKELWLSEFGWDTHEKSYQSAAFGHKLYPDRISMYEIQGQWLTRAYLAGAAAGIDRMMMYLANDIPNYPHEVFGWCGFIAVDGLYKPSWYYIKTLRYALSGMRFLDEYPSGQEQVWIYRFQNPTTGAGAYVLWCPTADGTILPDYSLKLTANVTSATKVELMDKQETGVEKKLDVREGTVQLTITERPVILLVDDI